MSSTPLKRGDQVAILSDTYTSCGKFLGISQIEYVGPAVTVLVDGREFFTSDGEAVDEKSYIVLATDEHRTAATRRLSTQ